MKALVTGGAGLIGSHIVDALLARGDQVTILDSLENPSTLVHNPQGVTFSRGRVEDRFAIRTALEGVEVVFHQAAIGGFAPAYARITEANCLGTILLMEEARRAGVARVVLASSQAVYGHGRWNCPQHGPVQVAAREESMLAAGAWDPRCPIDQRHFLTLLRQQETYPTEPTSVYGLSKLYAEKAALNLGEQYDIPVVALRYALTYGPRQSITNPYAGIASIFAQRAMNGNPPILFEDGHQLRDLTYVTDVARANLVAADTPEMGGRVFNVGTGVPTTVRKVAESVAEAVREGGLRKVPDPTKGFAYRPQDARHVLTDASLLRSFGWEPEIDAGTGLALFMQWYLRQPHGPDGWQSASDRMVKGGVIRGLS